MSLGEQTSANTFGFTYNKWLIKLANIALPPFGQVVNIRYFNLFTPLCFRKSVFRSLSEIKINDRIYLIRGVYLSLFQELLLWDLCLP